MVIKKLMLRIKDLTIFKGFKTGIIHTSDIHIQDILDVFFPKTFNQKYRYLGVIPYDEKGNVFKAVEPLVIFMDYKAKPKFCPRWFLRFLHLFGNDNSIVRVRNYKLHNLHRKLTKGYFMYDYKTKWEWYDLRISIGGDEQCLALSDAIESNFYNKGLRQDLADEIKRLDPETKYHKGYDTSTLREELKRLEEI
jgi:hypothetical protein